MSMTPQDRLAVVRREYLRKSNRLHRAFEQAGPDLDMFRIRTFRGSPQTKLAAIHQMNAELEALRVEKEQLEAIVENAARAALEVTI